jgi:hypothetical protein
MSEMINNIENKNEENYSIKNNSSGGVNCGKLDFTEIPLESLYANNNNVWIKAEVEEKIFNINNRPYVVLKFPNKCSATVCDDEQNLAAPVLFMLSSLRNYPTAGTNLNIGECLPTKTKSDLLNSEDKNKIESISEGPDLLSANIDGYVAPAVVPAGAVIPMKSNIFSYGPYISSNFFNSGGGTEVQVNPDLSPWVFGSSSFMNSVGQNIVNNQSIGLTRAETGSVTLPFLPSIGFLGFQLDAFGPALSSLSFSFGSNGISTTYEFRTYTPKFGSLSKHQLNRMKELSQNRNEMIKFLRNNQANQQRINARMSTVPSSTAPNSRPPIRSRYGSNSLATVLFGSLYNFRKTESGDDGQISTVGYTELSKSTKEMVEGYKNKAFISADGLYSPVSIKGDGDLPKYIEVKEDSQKDNKSSPSYAHPPFSKESSNSAPEKHELYNLDIKNLYLNPLSNPGQIPHHNQQSGNHAGHSISMVGREEEVPEQGLENPRYPNGAPGKYSQDYRFLGLKGPLVLHGWGYDTNGKPIPNSADNDSAAKAGNFKEDNLKDEFLKDWLQKPATWPVGPIDLRFDRNRGVWVSPQPFRIVVAKLDEDLEEYGSAKAKIINKKDNKEYGEKLFDKDGNEISATEFDSQAFIRVVDRLGKTSKKDDLVYVYYDTHSSEYIILSGEGSSSNQFVRFKLINPCSGVTTAAEQTDWSQYAGFGDKPLSYDSYAVRINCNGQPIAKDGSLLSDSDLQNMQNRGEDLIAVKNSVGKWGPSFSSIKDISKWQSRAATGFAIKIKSENKTKSQDSSPGNTDPVYTGQNDSENNNENKDICIASLDCDIPYGEEGKSVGESEVYEIIYIESYARIVYGQLNQDLYSSEEEASSKYGDDEWKKNNTKGNASLTIEHFYGNPDNGQVPVFLDNDEEEVAVRVFDPFLPSEQKSPFFNLKEGARVIAIFDEKTKQYDIIQSEKTEDPSSIVRFKVFEFCSSSSDYNHQDSWQEYAGYGDKLPNNHIIGIRINCDGQPINKQGDIISETEINEARNNNNNEDEGIFINLYDTCGNHGPSFAFYKGFNDWNSNAFTGFAAKIVSGSGNDSSCNNMGLNDQCSLPKAKYEKYDIIFIESYARFVECTLKQDLYPSKEKEAQYSGDSYKSENMTGNAEAEISSFYGGSPNAKEPKFYDNSISEIPFRVFDPYEGVSKDKNPFRLLKEGDRVLAVFNEKLKKYIIYSALNKSIGSKVVKFALVNNKKASDKTAQAVLVDEQCRPIDKDGELLTENNFAQNFITIKDPFNDRNTVGFPMSYASGPAIGSNVFSHHINGIPSLQSQGPFIGFAFQRGNDNSSGSQDGGTSSGDTDPDYNSQNSGSSGGSSPESNEQENNYQILTLERFAQYVTGIIGTKTAEDGYYYGAVTNFWDGRMPLTNSTSSFPKGLNLKLRYNLNNITGQHSFITGDFKEGESASGGSQDMLSVASKLDGCKFIAKLSDKESFDSIEELIYYIVESEHVALFGNGIIKDENLADALNEGDEVVKEDYTKEKIQSIYTGGFQWSPEHSQSNFGLIEIENRLDWIGKSYLLKNSQIYTQLVRESQGNPVYRIVSASTIAEVAEKKASSGKWGAGQESGSGSSSSQSFTSQNSGEGSGDFIPEKTYQGISPIEMDNPPKINPNALGSWMTYKDAPTVSLWDETNGAKVAGSNNYRLIYAKEAPIIIVGTASKKIEAKDTDNISITVDNASCPGSDKQPITTLISKIKNPLGFGAESGDKVIVQRVFSQTVENDANYYYSIIGVGGGAPQSCS